MARILSLGIWRGGALCVVSVSTRVPMLMLYLPSPNPSEPTHKRLLSPVSKRSARILSSPPGNTSQGVHEPPPKLCSEGPPAHTAVAGTSVTVDRFSMPMMNCRFVKELPLDHCRRP